MARYRKRHPFRKLIVVFIIVLLGSLAFWQFRKAPHAEDISADPSALNAEYDSHSPAPQTPDSYLLPTDTEYITASDLDRFTADEITLIRNEIYARHGYDFQNEAIRAYFDSKTWYQPVEGVNASTFNTSVFNEYETANIAVILAYEEGGHTSDTAPTAGVQEDLLTDNLASADAVNHYTLEMSESGDAVILVTGLQESWDGYPYHWLCTVYQDDPAQAIAQESVRGYSVNYGPTIISVPKLDAGTYHIQMTSVRYANPFLASFTTDPYTIQIIRYYHSAVPAYESGGLQTLQRADDVIWAFDRTGFIKLRDGACFAALMKNHNGAVVPLLIGTTATSVEYLVSSTGEIITAQGPVHSGYLDVNYYYSVGDDIHPYTEKSVDSASEAMLYVDARSAGSAIEEIIEMQEDEKYRAENGEVKYWLKKNKVSLIVGGAIALIAAFIAHALLTGSSGSSTSYSGYSGGSTYSGYSSSDTDIYWGLGREEWERLNDDLDAVQDALGGSGWADGV